MKLAYRAHLTIMLATWLTSFVFGQGLTGQVSGIVQDPSGGALPGATLTLTNVATSQTREVISDSSGNFVFTQLLPGTFRLVASASGFKRYEQTDIVLTATERVVLKPIVLQLGEMTENVEGRAEAAGLQTQSAERSGLISTYQTQNIPL